MAAAGKPGRYSNVPTTSWSTTEHIQRAAPDEDEPIPVWVEAAFFLITRLRSVLG
jgi:hypothetical protein